MIYTSSAARCVAAAGFTPPLRPPVSPRPTELFRPRNRPQCKFIPLALRVWASSSGGNDPQQQKKKSASPEENPNVAKAIKFYDDAVFEQEQRLRKFKDSIEELDLSIEAMVANGTPAFLVQAVKWGTDLGAKAIVNEERKIKAAKDNRSEFVGFAKEVEEELESVSAIEMEDFVGLQATGENAGEKAGEFVFQAFFSALIFTWICSLFSIEVGTIMRDPGLPTATQLATWAAWTVPYVGATAAAATFAPSWVGNLGTLRLPANDAFFGKLQVPSTLSIAAAFGYSQAVIYQGGWLLIFLGWYGLRSGSGDDQFLDPAVANEAAVAGALGGFGVMAPGLKALLAKPAAVVSTAALEAVTVAARILTFTTAFDGDEASEDAVVGKAYGGAPEGGGGKASSSASTSAQLAAMLPDPPKMSEEEAWATIARVFVASTWMGAETVVTGNLWYAVGTGVSGIATGLLARRAATRASGPAGD